MPDLSGQSIGRYHIVAPLGEGGMATVYKAYDTRLEREVAIKFIRTGQIPSDYLEKIQKRFEREAKRMAKFTHPNIVQIIDYGDHAGTPYLVMPYLAGGTLKDRMKARMGKPMPYQEAARLLAPVARALDYAHKQETIHRDVKPANILLTDEGHPMLSDFGVAKILDLEEGNTLTGTGAGVGTPEYMAPEQWLNKVVPQTDEYALGVVLYEMVTGRKPYLGDTPAAVMLKQNNDPLPRPKQFVPELPDEVEQVLYKALAKDPQNRYADMGAFGAALEKLAQGTLSPALHPLAGDGKMATLDGGQYSQSQSQTGGGNKNTIDYAEGDQPSDPHVRSSSAQSEKSNPSVVQTSSTASGEETPIAPHAQPVPAAEQRYPAPTLPPLPSAPSVKSEKYAVQTSLLLIGIGLLLFVVIIGGLNWLVNRPSKLSSETNAQTITTSVQEPTANHEKPTPTLFFQEQGEGALEIYPTITRTPTASNTPIASNTPEMTSTPQAGKTRVSEKDGMVNVYVPASEFLMGSQDSDSDAVIYENPQHKVYLDGYWMDKTEVTNGQYAKCVADGSCKEPQSKASMTHNNYYGNSQYADYPVMNVNWNQALTYCQWTGGRLPSEAEWEKAARGTDGGKYPWGDGVPDSSLLNFNGNVKDTTEVGSYPSGVSPYGMMDMAGNVWEWVNDWYAENYYQNSPQRNPTGPGSGEERGLRGGSWDDGPLDVRAAVRVRYNPYIRNFGYFGFRCVR